MVCSTSHIIALLEWSAPFKSRVRPTLTITEQYIPHCLQVSTSEHRRDTSYLKYSATCFHGKGNNNKCDINGVLKSIMLLGHLTPLRSSFS
jgi:hypothetical protein